MDAAGNEVVAGPFRRALAQHGRFDLQKPEPVEILARQKRDPVPQDERMLQAGAAQVDEAVTQPQLFGRQLGRAGLKGGRFALVEDFEALWPAGRSLPFQASG